MNKKLLSLIIAATVLFSCDDGKIYETTTSVSSQGFAVKLTGDVKGMDTWSDDYSIVVAGFSDDDFAVISKNIKEGATETVMSNVSETVKTIEVCAINKIRKRVATFYSVSVDDIPSDTLRVNAGSVEVNMFNAVQSKLFDSYCISCHGASTFAAAGLKLTSGNSYAHIVGKTSTRDTEGRKIVSPGDYANSFIRYVLETDVTSNWRMDHIEMVTNSDVLDLLKSWVNGGAKE